VRVVTSHHDRRGDFRVIWGCAAGSVSFVCGCRHADERRQALDSLVL